MRGLKGRLILEPGIHRIDRAIEIGPSMKIVGRRHNVMGAALAAFYHNIHDLLVRHLGQKFGATLSTVIAQVISTFNDRPGESRRQDTSAFGLGFRDHCHLDSGHD